MYDPRQYFTFEKVSAGGATEPLSLLRPLDNTHPLMRGFSSGHLGLDIDGVMHETIRAARYGKVIYNNFSVSTNPSALESVGRACFIEHYDSNGNVCAMTAYYHMNVIHVAVGAYVQEGQSIGTVGNSGYVIAGTGGDGSHLHFALQLGTSFNASSLYNLYYSNPFVDPAPYITRA